MRLRLSVLLLAGLALPGCAGSASPATPEAAAPASVEAVAGTWQAPAVVADLGQRPLARCLVYHDTTPCRPVYAANLPRLSLAPSGTGFVLWNRYDGERFQMASSRFLPQAGWQAPEDLPPGAGVGTPQDRFAERYILAGDGAGGALAAWSSALELRASRRLPGGGWQPVERVGESGDMASGLDAGGGALMVWRAQGDDLVWSRRDGAGWTPPAVLAASPGSQPFIYQHQLAVAADGSAFAAWTVVNQVVGTVGLPPEYDEVWASRWQPGRGWSPPRALARFEGGHVFSLGLAASPSGAVVAYQVTRYDRARTLTRILAQACTGASACDGGPWTGPVVLAGDESGNSRFQMPRLAGDGRGRSVVAWVASDDLSGRYRVAARFLDGGRAEWGPESLVAESSGYVDQLTPLRAALSPAGNAVVLWKHRDTRALVATLWAGHFVPRQGWTPVVRLRDGAIADFNDGVSEPELAMDGSGNALAAWTEVSGDRALVMAARLVAETR